MPRIWRIEDGFGSIVGWAFRCPACDEYHHVDGFESVRFERGDSERPTLSARVVTHGLDGRPLCDLEIRDGVIEYGSNCGHELAGERVPLERTR